MMHLAKNVFLCYVVTSPDFMGETIISCNINSKTTILLLGIVKVLPLEYGAIKHKMAFFGKGC